MSDAPPPRRPSRMRYLMLFVLGAFLGRLASTNLGPNALDTFDLLMVAGLALSIVWAWRSWARETFEQRRRDALKRQQRREQAREKRSK